MSEPSPLAVAAYRCDVTLVRHLLATGADPNGSWGSGTALHAAVDEAPDFFDESAAQIVVALLDAGATVNASDAEGYTPLHIATKPGRTALQLLIDRGADVNVRTLSDGNTPLHLSVGQEDPAGVTVLLAHRADQSLTNKHGQTPLDVAVELQEANSSDELIRIVELLNSIEQ